MKTKIWEKNGCSQDILYKVSYSLLEKVDSTKIQVQFLLILHLRKIEAKRILFIPQIRKIDEFLDWQPSQFINIVGKDDVAIPGYERGRGGSHSCAALLPVALAKLSACLLPSL